MNPIELYTMYLEWAGPLQEFTQQPRVPDWNLTTTVYALTFMSSTVLSIGQVIFGLGMLFFGYNIDDKRRGARWLIYATTCYSVWLPYVFAYGFPIFMWFLISIVAVKCIEVLL